MTGSHFSEAQIAVVLQQAEDAMAVGEVCRKAGALAMPEPHRLLFLS